MGENGRINTEGVRELQPTVSYPGFGKIKSKITRQVVGEWVCTPFANSFRVKQYY